MTLDRTVDLYPGGDAEANRNRMAGVGVLCVLLWFREICFSRFMGGGAPCLDRLGGRWHLHFWRIEPAEMPGPAVVRHWAVAAEEADRWLGRKIIAENVVGRPGSIPNIVSRLRVIGGGITVVRRVIPVMKKADFARYRSETCSHRFEDID